MEGNVLTVDTTMANGRAFHDVWTLAADGKSYTNQMMISGGTPRGDAKGGEGKGGDDKGGARPPIKFSFTKQE